MKKLYTWGVAMMLCFFASQVQAQSFTESFEGTTFPPAGWTRINAGTAGNWTRYTNTQLANYNSSAQDGNAVAGVFYNPTTAANTWLITPGQTLTAGTSYTLTFWYRVSEDAAGVYDEKMKVTVGTAATVAAQTTTLWDNNGAASLTNTTWEQGTISYTPTSNGTYYFGFNGYSNPDKWVLQLDNIQFGVTPSGPPTCTSPVLPANGATNVQVYPNLVLRWNPSAGATSYDVYISTTNPPTAADSLTNVTADSVALVTGPGAYGTTFYWYVVPRNSLGAATGCASSVASFTTKPAPPAPACVSTVAPANGAVNVEYAPLTLTWTSSPNATGYDIYIGTTNPPGDPSVNAPVIEDFADTTITLTGAAANTTYYWFVVPRNENVSGSGCNAVVSSFTTKAPPAIPTCSVLRTPVNGVTNLNPYPSITFKWDAVPGATSYDFFIGTTNPPPATPLTSPTADSIVLVNLAYSTTYYWYVAPKNSSGAATGCAISSFTTMAAPPAPANDDCANAVTIGTTAVTGNTVGATQSQAATACGTSPVGTANDDLWYMFTAVSTGNVVVTVQGQGTFDAVVEAFSGTCGLLTSITCSDSSLAGGREELTISAVAGTSYRVRVYNWYSALSRRGSFTIMASGAALPVTLTSFRGERAGDANRLSWSTATEQNNKGFDVQRSVDGTNFSSLGFVASKAESGNSSAGLNYSFVDSKPFAGTSYYRLNQIDKDGRSTYSDVVVLKGDKANALVMSNVYPNPVRNNANFIIAAPASERVNVIVTDLAGKVVKQQPLQLKVGDNNISLDVNALPSGNYMIKAICASGCESAVSKFVKH